MATWHCSVLVYIARQLRAIANQKLSRASNGVLHFFFPAAAASSLRSQEMTLPNMTTPFPSMKATRERPSQFLKVSHTNGCCGWKLHSAISLDFRECGSSIFLPPVSLPIFHFSFEM